MSGYKSDIEIAQETELMPIEAIAEKLNKKEDKAKLILVTAITPTPAGEGKTTTVVGVGDALNRIG